MIFDPKSYIDKLITTINETCDNARNALNLLMGISVIMGGLILGVDDEILFLDQGATVSYTGIPITVSTIFKIFPILYLTVYALLYLKILSIVNLVNEFKTTRTIIIKEIQSELLHPLSPEQNRTLEKTLNLYNNQLKSFFLSDALLYKGKLAISISYLLLYVIPLVVLVMTMVTFLPYQSWFISIIHWISILGLTGLFAYLMHKVNKINRRILITFLGLIICLLSVICCSFSAFVLWDRMHNGKINCLNANNNFDDLGNIVVEITYYDYYACMIKTHIYPTTAFDLSNKTLLKRPTPDSILAVAYDYDLHNKSSDKNTAETHFETAKWKYAEKHFLRYRSFKGIDLSHTIAYKIDLQESNLTGANLMDANLTNANLISANLTNTDLNNANLMSANLIGADLTSANLSNTNLTNANLIGADLSSTNLIGADLTSTNLSNTNLTNANLRRANLTNTDLSSTNLTNFFLSFTTLLTDANLSNANLSNVNLTSANLIGADLTSANLTNTDLTDAHLSSANLMNTDLSSTNLTNANLIGADFTSATLVMENLTGAIYSSQYFNNIPKTNFDKNSLSTSKMYDICTQTIINQKFNEQYNLEKRKRVGKGYDYSAYCNQKQPLNIF